MSDNHWHCLINSQYIHTLSPTICPLLRLGQKCNKAKYVDGNNRISLNIYIYSCVMAVSGFSVEVSSLLLRCLHA